MTRAFLKMSKDIRGGCLSIGDIDEDTVYSYLDTYKWPDPDLVIRSSGIKRMSNFLIWQTAYSELVFLDTLWPDFSPSNLLNSIVEYQERQRRFGS